MASTIQLQRTINLAQQFIRLSPLTFAANPANDPAFSNADWVKQVILAPPFSWRWNRTSGTVTHPTFVTVIGQSDYPVNIPTFGWIEKAVAYDPANGQQAFELQVGMVSGLETLSNQPARITAQYDDGSGNITFRVFPAPDSIYNVVVEYQNSATLFTAPTDTWEPIPDYLSYLVNTGFQARAYDYFSDPRYVPTMQLFLTQLAEASEGLSESAKNIWLTDKLNTMRQIAAVQSGKR